VRGTESGMFYSVADPRQFDADPHHFDANPDPACHFEADPEPDSDPACRYEADLEPTFFTLKRIRILASTSRIKTLKNFSNRLIFHIFWLLTSNTN
jgi:hypothetical protein